MLTVKTLHIYYVYAANINSITQYFSMNKFLIILNLSLILISSLSALIAFCVSPLVFLYFNAEICFIYGALSITIIIIIRHKENIFRLLKKEELKFKK